MRPRCAGWRSGPTGPPPWRLQQVLVEQFIASFKSAPEELVLDFDATDNPLHGQQEGRFFHGYYDCYCYLPLYVFCGQQLLCAYLRPSRIDGARHAAAILKLLVRRLRQVWPDVRIIFRGDSGFCRQRIINWCERSGVHYIVGLARNARLEAAGRVRATGAEGPVRAHGHQAALVGEFSYAAQSWSHERRVITRLEWGEQGCNPRFIVTNLLGHAQRAVRRSVLPARRGGEPHQGSAGRAVRNPHQLPRASPPTSCACCWPHWPTCSSSACARWPCRARRWRGAGRYLAHQVAQARRGDHPQHAAHPAVLGLALAQRGHLRACDARAASP